MGGSQVLLGAVLDVGAPELVRWLGGLAVAAVFLLAVLATMPIFLVAAVTAAPLTIPAAASVDPSAAPPRQAPGQPPPPQIADGRVVEVARRYLGVPYVFGGTNPAVGLDCSGLVQLVFRQLGVALPRTAQLQYNATPRVAQDRLQPGDLVFFARTYFDPNDWITHVGIYVGGGMQINAPTEGQVVSIQPVFSGFWGAHYAGAGRIDGV